MIITKLTTIKNNGRIKSHYQSLGLDVNGEFIQVPIELLTSGSKAVIEYTCDICGDVKKGHYKTYKKSILFDGLFYCSKCSIIKKRKSIKEKYGVESYTETKEFKEKSKKTCLEKYGHEFYQNSEEYKQKVSETCLEKYGCNNVMQDNSIFTKQFKSAFKFINYKDTDLQYQSSYEFDFLENFYSKIKITKLKPIKYKDKTKTHYYYPDFYLPDINLVVEIKSNYTYKYDISKNKIKQKTCEDNGYNFIFIIDKDYSEFMKLL
jgi:hypothetical protein